ncbi:MAG: FtsB family cell division protein [Candidatus Dormibacteria bacterium]
MNNVWLRLGLAALLAVLLSWVVYAFARQVYLAYSLDQQAAAIRQENAAIAADNARYQRQVTTAGTAESAEEQARRLGYTRPGEQVFIVAQPSPSPSPSPVPLKVSFEEKPQMSLWDQFRRWISDRWSGK